MKPDTKPQSSTRQSELILYSGPHCTLCEKAKQVIWPIIADTRYCLREVDITSDVDLLRQYRLSIPVVKRRDGNELGWPFDAEQLKAWLNSGEYNG